MDEQVASFENWFRIKSEVIRNRLRLSVKDMTKYLELDHLVKEKNDVLKNLSHLPISVRGNIGKSVLLSELQFNMLNKYEVVKKAIVTPSMITKLEVGKEDNSIFVGGVGTVISKYSAETKQLILASEKGRRTSLVYSCNGLLIDKKKQLWVMDGKKATLSVLDQSLREKKLYQGLSFDRIL